MASITARGAESCGLPSLAPPYHRATAAGAGPTRALRRSVRQPSREGGHGSGSVAAKRRNVAVASLAALLVGLLIALSLSLRQLERERARLREWGTDLADSAARLQAVADSVTEAIVILDAGGQMTMANRAAHRLFTAGAEALTACHVEQLLPALRPFVADPPRGGGAPGEAEVAAFGRHRPSSSSPPRTEPAETG